MPKEYVNAQSDRPQVTLKRNRTLCLSNTSSAGNAADKLHVQNLRRVIPPTVPEQKCCSLVLRDLLVALQSFLTEKHNVDFYIMFGTLLGAQREADFIKWTSDLDIAVEAESINVLVEYLSASMNGTISITSGWKINI